MEKAFPQGITISMLGQYAQVRCSKCKNKSGNWFTGLYGFIDCECTLQETGFKHRTLAKLDKYPLT